MIVGKGLLAQAFEAQFGSDSDIVIFAAGVSNSLETSTEEFSREDTFLRQALAGGAKRLVYFGSCGVIATEAAASLYMQHKKRMEALVLSSAHGLVFRLPQVVGVTNNSHTLTNFLRDRILSGEHFTVWGRAERNLIDIDDVVAIGASLAGDFSNDCATVISIASKQSMPMPEIVTIFERTLGKSGNYSTVDKGAPLSIDTRKAVEVGKRLSINLEGGYTERVIRKYYIKT